MPRIRSLLRARKAISPVIAALLLIAISVAAGVVTYSWVMTMIGTQGSQAQTAIRMDVVQFTNGTSSDSGANNGTIIVTVRNTGSVAATIATVYITDPDNNVFTLDLGDAPDFETSFDTTNKDTVIVGSSKVVSAGETVEYTIHLKNVANWAYHPTSSVNHWELASAYKIKVVTDNGFAAEGTYYSPSSYPSS